MKIRSAPRACVARAEVGIAGTRDTIYNFFQTLVALPFARVYEPFVMPESGFDAPGWPRVCQRPAARRTIELSRWHSVPLGGGGLTKYRAWCMGEF